MFTAIDTVYTVLYSGLNTPQNGKQKFKGRKESYIRAFNSL